MCPFLWFRLGSTGYAGALLPKLAIIVRSPTNNMRHEFEIISALVLGAIWGPSLSLGVHLESLRSIVYQVRAQECHGHHTCVLVEGGCIASKYPLGQVAEGGCIVCKCPSCQVDVPEIHSVSKLFHTTSGEINSFLR